MARIVALKVVAKGDRGPVGSGGKFSKADWRFRRPLHTATVTALLYVTVCVWVLTLLVMSR